VSLRCTTDVPDCAPVHLLRHRAAIVPIAGHRFPNAEGFPGIPPVCERFINLVSS